MTEVYMVRHLNAPADSPPAALRRILPFLSKDASFIKMFLHEARIINRLEHKNLIRLLDFGKENEQYFMVTEFVWGVTIKEIIERCVERKIEVPYVFTAKIIEEICDGLDYAHNLYIDGQKSGIIHLDINSNNIMIDFDGVAKLLDFGIAHAAYLGDSKTLRELKGTLAYMSPEQCQEMDVDQRSDVFSLGVVLYELATQTPLFSNHTSEYEAMKAITEGRIPAPSSIKKFPRELEDIILLALKVSPSERYQSAKELKNALGSYLSGIEFDPEQENLNVWLAKLFPEKYEAFAPFMLPARRSTGEFAMPFIQEPERQTAKPADDVPPPQSAQKKISEVKPVAQPESPPPVSQSAQRKSSEIKPAAQSEVAPPQSAQKKTTESKAVSAAEAPSIRGSRKSTSPQEQPAEEAAANAPTQESQAEEREPEEGPKPLGHVIIPVSAAVIAAVLLFALFAVKTRFSEPKSEFGRVSVYTSVDDDRLEEPVKVQIDDKSYNLPVEGILLKEGKHEIYINDSRFSQVHEFFNITKEQPLDAFYFELNPKNR